MPDNTPSEPPRGETTPEMLPDEGKRAKQDQALVGRYVVVTPARNEADHLHETIESMMSQTRPPSQWCIVDDGSTDDTASIARDAAEGAPWISVVSRDDRGYRFAGEGVVAAVNAGIAAIQEEPRDFVVKLDADLRFGPTYFEDCLHAFASDPHLGIAGGTVHTLTGTSDVIERHPQFHVRGATKIYRRETFSDIGGLKAVSGWDTIDEVTANMHGWATRTLDVPIFQLRQTGDAAGQWNNWVKNGKAAYISGYHPAFLLARAARRLPRPPIATAGVGLVWGYTRAALVRTPKAVDETTQSYVRTQQLNRLLGRPSIWR